MKLIVAACNAATSAALPALQESLAVPIVGVLVPEAHAAVQATRNRRIGLLATEATVASGRYEEVVHALDAGAQVVSVACPRLVPLIEAGNVGAELDEAVREYAAPLRAADVDTVILGCTHYPMIRRVFERAFGRGTTLVYSADETAREVAETLARKGVGNDEGREGSIRFLTTGAARGVPGARGALPPAADPQRRAGDRPRARAGALMTCCQRRRGHPGPPPASSVSPAGARVARGPCRDGDGVSREGRRVDELRPVELVTDFVEQAAGSALISFGRTRVLCTASVEDSVPRWLVGSGRGWLTAEYGMLPASTGSRTPREASAGKQKGRTVEIQRLLGRSLRAVYDLGKLGERTIWIDCDVLQADGGTRTAAISGAWVALTLAVRRAGLPEPSDLVGAVSVGIVDGERRLDLDYVEDAGAEVDMNVVMTGDGRLVEVQATAERVAFTRAELDALVDLAAAGIAEIGVRQREAVA